MTRDPFRLVFRHEGHGLAAGANLDAESESTCLSEHGEWRLAGVIRKILIIIRAFKTIVIATLFVLKASPVVWLGQGGGSQCAYIDRRRSAVSLRDPGILELVSAIVAN